MLSVSVAAFIAHTKPEQKTREGIATWQAFRLLVLYPLLVAKQPEIPNSLRQAGVTGKDRCSSTKRLSGCWESSMDEKVCSKMTEKLWMEKGAQLMYNLSRQAPLTTLKVVTLNTRMVSATTNADLSSRITRNPHWFANTNSLVMVKMYWQTCNQE